VDRFSGFEEPLRALVAGRTFDVGVIEHFWCAPYASALRSVCRRLVLDVHNVESVLLHRQSRLLTGPARSIVGRFATCAAELERIWLPRFDTVLVTSDADRERLGTGLVYPNAVPEVKQPNVEKHNEISFSGNLGYEPNYTAVRWFIENVWPELHGRRPRLGWRVIGRNESAVRGLVSGDEQITLTGPVEDAVKELARARLAIVPVQAGSGTRIKIIEAWAAGLPVVSTTIGAEGLPAVPGEHLLIADTPAEFLTAIEKVLDSPELQLSLGRAGRRLYERRLTWTAAWEALKQAHL
jgi:glycosyltransferase involved in cell wall biosynthesis